MRKLLLLLAAVFVACGGPKSPSPEARKLPESFTAALEEEAHGDPAKARDLYATIVDVAAASPEGDWSLPALDATLDALVTHAVPGLSDTTDATAILYRQDKPQVLISRFEKALESSQGPFSKGAIARALVDFYQRKGDAATAEKYRKMMGCAREATLIGPLVWAPISGVKEKDPLEAFDAAIDARYPAAGPLSPVPTPLTIKGRGCDVPLAASHSRIGVRDVVVDVDVPSGQEIGVALRTSSTATLRVGGRIVLERPYDLGGERVVRYARVKVDSGRVRIVARVGMDDDSDTVEIDAWDEDGKPLVMSAPQPGSKANAKATASSPVMFPAPKTAFEQTLAAAASLAWGDGHTAERALMEAAKAPTAPLPTLLMYARAVDTARDIRPVHRAERERGIHERILDKWPDAWESVFAHAMLAATRKGMSEARIEALLDLDKLRSKLKPAHVPLADAFEAALAGREGLYDRAKAAFERAKPTLDGTMMLYDVGASAYARSGVEAAKYLCATSADHDRNDFGCYDAQARIGQKREALKELDRIRALRGAPSLYWMWTARDALGIGDMELAKKAWAELLPMERSLGVAIALDKKPDGTLPSGKDAIAKVLDLAPTMGDAPASIAPLIRSMGDDPIPGIDDATEKLVKDDRAKPSLETAATAVLWHDEKCELRSSGLLHYIMIDVRRLAGTTDVEMNAAASSPDIFGRYSSRTLRRRIFKKDGRVLTPDMTPNAQQGHAELSQLEAGDIVQAIYEGWGLPSETGDCTIDTPDVLPERVSVLKADIELSVPAALKANVWSHALLGKAKESVRGDAKVYSWHIGNMTARHIEDGVPKMDRDVRVSFSTRSWNTVAVAFKETLAGLEDHEPEVLAWATDAATGKTPKSRDVVDAVVARAGDTIRESNPGTLSDLAMIRMGGSQGTTARTILTDREGNRTWVIVRALRELGIPTDVVIAENDPYSADPSFPVHVGRFMHPLAVAHAQGGDVWIDADVSGPPLPAGQVSPELRGRTAMMSDGTMQPLPAKTADPARDEIDLRLAVDESGDAKGSLTILLKGRAAQEISQALLRVVGSERDRALRQIVLGWLPFANVETVSLSSAEGSWQIALRADVTAFAYAQPEGTTGTGKDAKVKTWVLPGLDPIHYVYPRGAVSTLGATYASLSTRENALAISRAVQFHFHRRVELPKQATVVRSPGPLDVKSGLLEGQRTLTVSANVIEESFTLGIATGTIAPDKYTAFVTDAHRIDDGFLASVRVKP